MYKCFCCYSLLSSNWCAECEETMPESCNIETVIRQETLKSAKVQKPKSPNLAREEDPKRIRYEDDLTKDFENNKNASISKFIHRGIRRKKKTNKHKNSIYTQKFYKKEEWRC